MIFRIKKNTHYVTIKNSVLRDERLSWCARGIMAYLLTLPDTDLITIEALTEKAKEGRRRVAGSLKELEQYGYFQRRKFKNELGQWIWEMDVFEEPESTLSPQADFHPTESGRVESGSIRDPKTKKEEITPLPPYRGTAFTEALSDFMAHHREIGKPYKPTGLKRLYADLASWGEDQATEALRESVRNRWQGVFRPKGNGTGNLPYEHPNAYRPGKMVL